MRKHSVKSQSHSYKFIICQMSKLASPSTSVLTHYQGLGMTLTECQAMVPILVAANI